MNDPVIDLHMLFVSELGGMVRSFLMPHRRHSVIVLEKDTLILQPRKTRPNVTERLLTRT